jgi:hypothetical protein
LSGKFDLRRVHNPEWVPQSHDRSLIFYAANRFVFGLSQETLTERLCCLAAIGKLNAAPATALSNDYCFACDALH